MKNKKSLSWWVRYFDNSECYDKSVVGKTFRASIFDVMPNLRSANHRMGAELDQCEATGPSMTKGPILVQRDKYKGYLVITDGHHRFNEAVVAGEKFIDVVVEGECCAWELPFTQLSIEEKNEIQSHQA